MRRIVDLSAPIEGSAAGTPDFLTTRVEHFDHAAGAAALLAQTIRNLPVSIQPEVIDTTGAGDAFAAGFIAATLTSRGVRDIRIALGRGFALATSVLATVGGQPKRSRVQRD